jgi:hypothetical protein
MVPSSTVPEQSEQFPAVSVNEVVDPVCGALLSTSCVVTTLNRLQVIALFQH